MSFFAFPRVPEPEIMDEADEVEAYSSAAAQKYLDQIDNSFVEHAERLVKGLGSGCALDIGTGPGQIVIKLAKKLPGWRFIGVDRSPNMIAQAESGASQSGQDLAERVEFRVADGNRLLFPDASFDLVMCNSVLHHMAQPGNLLSEIARLAKPTGAVLLRDLRRPSRLAYPWHVRLHGRHYSGMMYKLYCDSVRAAYTPEELEGLIAALELSGVRVFTRGATHLGFGRAAAA